MNNIMLILAISFYLLIHSGIENTNALENPSAPSIPDDVTDNQPDVTDSDSSQITETHTTKSNETTAESYPSSTTGVILEASRTTLATLEPPSSESVMSSSHHIDSTGAIMSTATSSAVGTSIANVQSTAVERVSDVVSSTVDVISVTTVMVEHSLSDNITGGPLTSLLPTTDTATEITKPTKLPLSKPADVMAAADSTILAASTSTIETRMLADTSSLASPTSASPTTITALTDNKTDLTTTTSVTLTPPIGLPTEVLTASVITTSTPEMLSKMESVPPDAISTQTSINATSSVAHEETTITVYTMSNTATEYAITTAKGIPHPSTLPDKPAQNETDTKPDTDHEINPTTQAGNDSQSENVTQSTIPPASMGTTEGKMVVTTVKSSMNMTLSTTLTYTALTTDIPLPSTAGRRLTTTEAIENKTMAKSTAVSPRIIDYSVTIRIQVKVAIIRIKSAFKTSLNKMCKIRPQSLRQLLILLCKMRLRKRTSDTDELALVVSGEWNETEAAFIADLALILNAGQTDDLLPPDSLLKLLSDPVFSDVFMSELGVEMLEVCLNETCQLLQHSNITVDELSENERGFFRKHIGLFTALILIGSFCGIILILGLIYLRCRRQCGSWERCDYLHEDGRSSFADHKKDHIGEENPVTDVEITSDEVMHEKYDGNGMVAGMNGAYPAVSKVETGIIPFDQLTWDERMEADFIDTRL